MEVSGVRPVALLPHHQTGEIQHKFRPRSLRSVVLSRLYAQQQAHAQLCPDARAVCSQLILVREYMTTGNGCVESVSRRSNDRNTLPSALQRRHAPHRRERDQPISRWVQTVINGEGRIHTFDETREVIGFEDYLAGDYSRKVH